MPDGCVDIRLRNARSFEANHLGIFELRVIEEHLEFIKEILVELGCVVFESIVEDIPDSVYHTVSIKREQPKLLVAQAASMPSNLIIGAQLGAPGKDKIVHRGTSDDGKEWAVAKLKKPTPGGITRLRAEVAFQKRAAIAGLAPQVSEELSDLSKGVVVMELVGGGTLKAVLERQNGELSEKQQRSIVHLLDNIGGPGCEMLHGDLGNPLNYVLAADGTFRLIDFGFASDITPGARADFGDSPRLNLFYVGTLVWGGAFGWRRRLLAVAHASRNLAGRVSAIQGAYRRDRPLRPARSRAICWRHTRR